jgi:hypothetical protein
VYCFWNDDKLNTANLNTLFILIATSKHNLTL